MKRRVVTGTYTRHDNGLATAEALDISAYHNDTTIDPNGIEWDHFDGAAVRLISIGDPVHRRAEPSSVTYSVKVEIAYDPHEYEWKKAPTEALFHLADELIWRLCHGIEEDHQPY